VGTEGDWRPGNKSTFSRLAAGDEDWYVVGRGEAPTGEWRLPVFKTWEACIFAAATLHGHGSAPAIRAYASRFEGVDQSRMNGFVEYRAQMRDRLALSGWEIADAEENDEVLVPSS
jgi:hypothetical protein